MGWGKYREDNQEIINDRNQLQLLRHIDVLVDGLFEYSKRDISLAFRGSSNQRIIDVKQSLKQGKVVNYELKQNSKI